LQKPVQNGAVVMALKRYTPRVDLQMSFRMPEIFNKMGDIGQADSFNHPRPI